MKYLIVIATFLLSLNLHVQAQSSDTYTQMSDSLCALMEGTAGTTEGLDYADELLTLAQKAGDAEIVDYAAKQKLNMLYVLGRYDECIDFADNLVANLDTVSNNGLLYFAQFVKVTALIDQGKFKSAIQLAQKMYDDSKKVIHDSDGNDISIRTRCNALYGLGLANEEMEHSKSAIDNFTEAINLIQPDDSANMTLRLDLQTSRMQSAQHLKDRSEALSFISNYENEIADFRQSIQGNPKFEYLFIEDYNLLMQIAFVDVLTDLRRYSDAASHIAVADSLLAEYPSLVDNYVAELNSIKAKYFEATGRFNKSVAYADSALEYYQEFGLQGKEISVMKTKLRATHALGLYAYEYPLSTHIMTLMDSVYRQRYTSQVQDMQTIMDVDKLQNEKVQYEQRAALFSAQRQMWIFVSISIFLAAIVTFTLFKRKRDREKQRILSNQKQMLEREVDRQTKQLREQNEAIEKQNEEITDSINYAFRIQQSILPNLDFFKGLGNGACYAFYVPCHIVSGDFYWARTNGGIDVIVCADCTGHGVPGAFMTMIGTTILNDLFDHNIDITPDKMLENLHINLLNILQQSGEENSKDGMDLTVLRFDRENKKVSIASAKRPVYLYRKDGQMQELKEATVKRSIGDRDYNAENLPFRAVEFDIAAGDTIYMSSDGLADLFGGPKRQRFMKKRVQELMDEIVTLPMDQQFERVRDVFFNWLSDGGRIPENQQEQLDDVSFMGVRF